MTVARASARRVVLPLPRFVWHPLSAIVVAAVHVYLASEHLFNLMTGHLEWTHVWKGFGALGGAYVFAALALRAVSARREKVAMQAPESSTATAG